MKRDIFPLLLFFLFAGAVDAQSADFSFTLRGSIDADTGTMQLLRVNDAYYPVAPAFAAMTKIVCLDGKGSAGPDSTRKSYAKDTQKPGMVW